MTIWLAAALAFAPLASAAESKTPATAIAKARAVYAKREAAKAIEILSGALRRWPDDPDLHLAYQRLKHNTGWYENVFAEYWKRHEAAPNGLNAYLLARLEDDRSRAADTVDKAVRSGAKHPGLDWFKTTRRVAALAYHGKYEEALALIDADAAGRKLDPCGWAMERATLLLRMGKLADAWKMTEEARRADPYEPATTAVRAHIAILRGDLDGMNAELHAGPYWAAGTFAWAENARAYYQSHMGLPPQAKSALEGALATRPDGVSWNASIANALDGLGRPDEALPYAQAALEGDPYDDASRIRVASARSPEALEKAVAEVYARNPRGYLVLMRMAHQHIMQGRARESVELYSKALAYAPGLPDLWAHRGMARRHLKDKAGAAADLDRAATLAPFNADIHRAQGSMALEAGKYLECRSHYISAYEYGTDEERYNALGNWGQCAAGAGLFEESIAAFDRAADLTDKFAAAMSAGQDASWAKNELKAVAGRYPNDENAVSLSISGEAPLSNAPRAAYGAEELLAGAPGAAASRRVPEPFSRPRWTRDGRAVFYAVKHGIKNLSLATGATTWALRDQNFWGHYEISDDGGEVYAVLDERNGVRLSAINPRTGAARILYRRGPIGQLARDAKGRLFLLAGGNQRLDPASAVPPVEWGLVGCLIEVAISPDGERLACVTANETGPENGELIVYDIASKKKTFLKAAGRRPEWSPDGRRLAYVWRERELRVIDTGTLKVTAYGNPWKTERLQARGPYVRERTRWSPDGRFLAYTIAETPTPPEARWYDETPRGRRRFVVTDLELKRSWVHEEPFKEFEWAPAAY